MAQGDLNFSKLQEQLEAVMRQAGKLLISYYGRPLEIIPKKQGFTTQADIAIEQFLLQELKCIVPEASFYAEESGVSGDQTSDYCWVIDPVDGTTNFVRGIPYFCISIALVFQEKPVVGSIYQPLLDEFFYAQYHAGAWLNGVLLPSYNSTNRTKHIYTSAKKIIVAWPKQPTSRGGGYTLRYFGAAALDCAYLACGKIDGLAFNRVAWWDIAAGLLLLQETKVPVTYTKQVARGQVGYKVTAGEIVEARPY